MQQRHHITTLGLLIAFTALLAGNAARAQNGVQVDLPAGLSLYTHPVDPPPAFNCEDLKALSGAVSIARLDAVNQLFESCSAPDSVFPVVASEGYTVELVSDGSFVAAGGAACRALDLEKGVNLIGVPSPPANLGCFELLQAIGGRGVVASVQRLASGSAAFEACSYPQAPPDNPVGFDFPILSHEAYLVSLRRPVPQLQLNDPARCAPDADGDGVPDPLDCEPGDERIFPGAPEICGDAIDSDCSFLNDDKDADGDAHIDLACGGDDVNDDDPRINPKVEELCDDGVDNNSNLLVDLDDPVCAPGCDGDGDGHPSLECGGFDADDADPNVAPGNAEVCDDFVDNNLDGEIDEGCHPDDVAIGPQDVNLFTLDTQSFVVVGEGASQTAWRFEVDGIPGGDDAVGRIDPSAVVPNEAFYRAPDTNEVLEVTVLAVDPQDPTRTASTAVTVLPLVGTFVVQPANVTLGLSQRKQFQAGLNVEGIGFVPLRAVFWKVNDVLDGTSEIGRVNTFGDYKAPEKMPGPLPFGIAVGFAGTSGGPALATANVTLAELDLDPDSFERLAAGPAGTLTARLRKSDASNDPVAAAGLNFYSDRPDIATVAANGGVAIGQDTGRAVLLGVHTATGARDTSLAFSLSDVDLELEVVQRSRDFARIERGASGVTEIEFTRPGASFNLDPIAKLLRGQNAGLEISGANRDLFTITADGADIQVFNQSDDPEPDLDNLVAAVEERTRLVVIGRRPGSGTITVIYDDGRVQRSLDLRVVFSRLGVTVQSSGSASGGAGEIFVTEYGNVTITLSNPNGSFIGETPIHVFLAGGESLQVAYGNDVASGKVTGNFKFNNLAEASEFVLSAASTADPLHDEFEGFGRIQFKFAPQRGGEHRFQISLPNDPGVAPVEHVIDVKRPAIAVSTCRGTPLASEDRIVANSWTHLSHRGPGTPFGLSIYDAFIEGDGIAFRELFDRFHNDPPSWKVDGPSGVTPVPLTNIGGLVGGGFAAVLQATGERTISLGFGNRPEIRSEEVSLTVVAPTGGTFAEVAALPLNPQSGSGIPVPEANQLAAMHIQMPTGGAWVGGVAIPVQVQFYNADGEPRAIGQTRRVIMPGLPPFVSHTVLGLEASFAGGPPVDIQGELLPNRDGVVNFAVVPREMPSIGAENDLIVSLRPVPFFPANFEGLPVEEEVFNDQGELIQFTPNPFAVADFENPADVAFLEQCVFVSGRGLAADPRQIPVPSQRVRDAVANGRLAPGSEQIRFRVLGSGSFAEAVASGLAPENADLGPGLSLVASAEKDGALLVTASADNAAFEAGGGASLGLRDIRILFEDGSEWETEIQVFGTDLDKPFNHADVNLALNARQHNAHPVGAQIFSAIAKTLPLGKLELELIPSILPGKAVRNAIADQPLVGFRREPAPRDETTPPEVATDEIVSDLRTELFQSHNSFFPVFGNTTDRFRLNFETGELGTVEDPDRLPDFVSPSANAEALTVGLGGNIADVLFFTAYNFVATTRCQSPTTECDAVKQPLHDPAQNPFDFDQLKGSIEDTYDAYRLPDGAMALDVVGQLAGNDTPNPTQINPRVAVSVDSEAIPATDIDFDDNRLVSGVPVTYFGGVLDQFFIAALRPFPSLEVNLIGQDGRVGKFNGERGENPFLATGHDRRGFGVELDGVLYDPSIAGLDEAPNGPDLIGLPIVGDIVREAITEQNLLPDQGGTSGGYYDLDSTFEGGYKILAKTPGAEFPGVQAGYLIQDKPEDLTDARFGSPEDDIFDVILKRVPKIRADGSEAPDRIVEVGIREEKTVFGNVQRRRLMGYGKDHDRKAPITTAINTVRRHLITTDPEGLDPVDVQASLLLRERPPTAEDSISLLVTTKSTGTEGTVKVVLDAVSDLVIDLTATVVLAAVTEGGWVAACGGPLSGALEGEFKSKLVDIYLGVTANTLSEDPNPFDDFSPDQEPAKRLLISNDILQSGSSPFVVDPGAPDPSVRVDLNTIYETAQKSREAFKLADSVKGIHRRLATLQRQSGLESLPFCVLLKAPFVQLKKAVKNSFTVEDLGGNGAGQAFGKKLLTVSIPASARRGPGVYVAQYGVSRKIDILPKEPFARDLAALPGGFDPGSDRITDIDLLRQLLRDADESEFGKQAQSALQRIRTNTVRRTRGSLAVHTIYDDHKLRYFPLPELDAIVTPGDKIDAQQRMGNFVLTSGETIIPVSAAAVVTATRTNPNAGARAAISSEGYDLFLLNASIPSPEEP